MLYLFIYSVVIVLADMCDYIIPVNQKIEYMYISEYLGWNVKLSKCYKLF